MKVPKALQNLMTSFEKLPGIGPKTAQRLTFYLLHVPESELEEFARNLSSLKGETKICSICHNVTEEDPCPICLDPQRDKEVIMVVEQPLDVVALERTGKFNGVYHVLHGAINPLENIGPDELFMNDLFEKVKEGEVKEVIIATNPTMEGDATAMYISKKLKAQEPANFAGKLKITRLGMGVPTGADLEYADEATLKEAIEGRREI